MKTLGLLLLFLTSAVLAASSLSGNYIRYFGTGTNSADILFTTGDMTQYDACNLMSTTGAVNVFVSLDGTNFSTSPQSLQDFGSTDVYPVVVTVASRMYGFVGKFLAIRVQQSGSSASAASMNCWRQG